MLSEREVNTDVRDLLINNRPFQYGHLIKFERPSRPDSTTGVVSTSAHRYAYFTDASRDVAFNDGTIDHLGNPNGTQTYIANKVLNVSNVQEATEAKASNFTITLDGNGIGAYVSSANVVVTATGTGNFDFAFPVGVSLLDQGFREGDKVLVTSGTESGQVTILNFMQNNTIRVDPQPGVAFSPGTFTVTFDLSSEEIKSILLNKNASDYASFINREVFIYRAYFENGNMVGQDPDVNGNRGPILIFKGIISNVSFDDDDGGIKVQWGLTSHWGDFAQVRGRITSDDFHRALDQNGIPQPLSTIKTIYAYDKGFAHAETSINLLSQYSVQVEKQDIKTKSGVFGLGIGAKVKVKKYFVNETRNTNLDFQLAAKTIPVVYGVRSLTGIPVFADTKLDDSSTVYVVYALSEGQIGGIYDIYINGKSLICNNESDFDVRSQQNTEETIDVICRGRADRGDVLGGTTSVDTSTTINYYNEAELRNVYSQYFNPGALTHYQPYLPPEEDVPASNTGSGIIHGESVTLTSPSTFTLDFFSGTEGQKAASQLVEIAKAKGFKVQNDYWTGDDSAEYWGPNHRLADTAYLVGKYSIKEGETSIPDLEFIIRGKALDCYNYDYSFTHDQKYPTEDPDNFILGSTVSLYRSDTATVINSDVQIIDKWSFVRPDGVRETRFRFSEVPNLSYTDGVPAITALYMNNGTDSWHMTTFNRVLHSGTVPSEVVLPATETAGPDSTLAITTSTPIGGDPTQPSPVYSIIDPVNPANQTAIIMGTYTGGQINTSYNLNMWNNR